MKYKNTKTGVIVEPSSDLAAQAFACEPWEEYEEAPKGDVADKPLSKMTAAELEATAAEFGVDLTDCTKNAERIAKIEEAQKGGEV